MNSSSADLRGGRQVDAPGPALGDPPGRDPMDRVVALLEIALLAGFLTQTFAAGILHASGRLGAGEESLRSLFLFTSVDTLLVLALVAVLQSRRGGLVIPFGLRPSSLSQEMGLGLAAGMGLTVLVGGSDWFFRTVWPSLYTEENPLLRLVDGPNDLLLLLGVGIVGGGVREEIQRAFILMRFEVLLRPARAPAAARGGRTTGGGWVGLWCWSLLFGLSHLFQGPDAAITAGVAGLLLGALFLWRRSVLSPMIGHSLANAATALIAYGGPGSSA